MNSNSREALIKVISAVESLTQSCLRDVGMEDAKKIIQDCEDAKRALDHDETIPD